MTVIRTEPIGEPFSRPCRKGIYQLYRFFTMETRLSYDRDTGQPNGYLIKHNWYVKDVRIDNEV